MSALEVVNQDFEQAARVLAQQMREGLGDKNSKIEAIGYDRSRKQIIAVATVSYKPEEKKLLIVNPLTLAIEDLVTLPCVKDAT